MKYLQLNDIDCYKRALALSNYLWNIVVGKKDKVKFYRISFGSVKESLDWNEKAKMRKLLTNEQYKHILDALKALPKEINQLIQFTNKKLKK